MEEQYRPSMGYGIGEEPVPQPSVKAKYFCEECKQEFTDFMDYTRHFTFHNNPLVENPPKKAGFASKLMGLVKRDKNKVIEANSQEKPLIAPAPPQQMQIQPIQQPMQVATFADLKVDAMEKDMKMMTESHQAIMSMLAELKEQQSVSSILKDIKQSIKHQNDPLLNEVDVSVNKELDKELEINAVERKVRVVLIASQKKIGELLQSEDLLVENVEII